MNQTTLAVRGRRIATILVTIAILLNATIGCETGNSAAKQTKIAAGPAESPASSTSTTAAHTGSEKAASGTGDTPLEKKPIEPAPQPTITSNKTSADVPTAESAKTDDANAPPADQVAQKEDRPDGGPQHPFARRLSTPDFPKDLEWLNVSGPLRKQDLRGKFVLLDFWTYCCINCMHILPELKKLEKAYPNELIVIGVHSAKFETEKGSKNIEEAILRYEIAHPVVNDADHKIWDMFGVRSWPTAILIDPEGNAIWGRSGEFQFAEVDEVLKLGLPYYRQQKTLDETPVRFELAAHRQEATPLRFPGKVLADEAGGRLFIADSNHNRIVVAGFDGKWLATIGSGAIGHEDGDFASATFDHPQGMTLVGETLYVADTENHMLRKIDLIGKRVVTIAGTGKQGKGWPGIEKMAAGDEPPPRWIGKPKETELNSPWDLWVHQKVLYIAMAGPHQIWKMPLDEAEIGPYAGNGREDIVDGPLLPRLPYDQGYASFAQPSGLSSDGEWLYVADSEGSSIRAVPFDPSKEVRTVVGTADQPFNRLFMFGDQDGAREKVLLQHCLGVAFVDGQLYIADTYNNKIKTVDPKTGATKTLVGTGKPGFDDATGEFDEPAGISAAKGILYIADTNNHQIRTVDPSTKKVGTLTIAGLTPPAPPREGARKPDFSRAAQVAVAETKASPKEGQIVLSAALNLPKGWKINSLAPMRYWIDATGETGPVNRAAFGSKQIDPPASEFTVTLPVSGTGADALRLSLIFYYCEEGAEGLCKVGSVVWNIPLTIAASGSPATVSLKHQVAD